MASPQRIFQIYATLLAHAHEVAAAQVAAGETVSRTVNLLLQGDAAKPLRRWGEEMAEIHGVLDGTHADPYALEATQTWYWACLYSVLRGASWADIAWPQAQQAAAAMPDASPAAVLALAQQVVAQGTSAQPSSLFVAWALADRCYRSQPGPHLTITEIMERDLLEMATRRYLQPILKLVPETAPG